MIKQIQHAQTNKKTCMLACKWTSIMVLHRARNDSKKFGLDPFVDYDAQWWLLHHMRLQFSIVECTGDCFSSWDFSGLW